MEEVSNAPCQRGVLTQLIHSGSFNGLQANMEGCEVPVRLSWLRAVAQGFICCLRLVRCSIYSVDGNSFHIF